MEQLSPSKILITAREAKDWTQEVMAKKLGITPRQYQRYEKGKFPKQKREPVQAIDRILGTTIYGMIYDKDVPHETNRERLLPKGAAVEVAEPEVKYGNGNLADKPETPDLHTLIKTMEDFARANIIREEKEKILAEAHLVQTRLLEKRLSEAPKPESISSALGHIDEELSHIRGNTNNALAYHHAWVDYTAENVGGDDPKKAALERTRMNKLVAERLEEVEKKDTQSSDIPHKR